VLGADFEVLFECLGKQVKAAQRLDHIDAVVPPTGNGNIQIPGKGNHRYFVVLGINGNQDDDIGAKTLSRTAVGPQ